ncbi:MAG: glycosyltransferase, partial [Vicinamibacterales bacterium]
MSVVVPAYNAARTIGATLDSLLSQTHSTWEAVVVNDGSTDRTGDIVSDYASRDARIRLISQRNGGESAARNAGLAHTHFGWLLFLDADDWIACRHLEKMTAALAGDRMLDAVHCAYARVAADGHEIEDPYRPPIGDLFPTLARRAAFPVHACVVRKNLIDEVGGFDTTLRTSPDWDLWQRVARTGANFGAVREVLAFYRMSPTGASLDARQLFTDGMRVLARGAAPDPRVPRPHPSYAHGWTQEPVVTQEFYLLAWCAGLMLGADRDARSLFDLVDEHRFPELYPDAVAQCLFEAVPLPSCRGPGGWDTLWPRLRGRIEHFLLALERQSQAPDLAQKALGRLRRMVLHASPTWSIVQEGLTDMKALFDQERQTWQRLAEERERNLAAQQQLLDDLRRSHAVLEADRENWRHLAEQRERTLQQLEQARADSEQLAEERARRLDQQRQILANLQAEHDRRLTETQADNARLEAERNDLKRQMEQRATEVEALRRSDERVVGDFLLNRLRLKTAVRGAAAIKLAVGHSATVARLTLERGLDSGQRHRVMATACDVFPIYSQTFVYQELTQLARQGFSLRFIYSKLDSRDFLQSQFASLWHVKRRLFLSHAVHERDFARYRRRMPAKVEPLVEMLCQASGMAREALISHGNFLQAFSFTRMVEAYRPAYLHSYFFYDRSLMALVASY